MVVTESQELSPASFYVNGEPKGTSEGGPLKVPSARKTVSKPLVQDDDDCNDDFLDLYQHISSHSPTVRTSATSISIESPSEGEFAEYGYEDAAPDRRSLCMAPKVPCDDEEDDRSRDIPKRRSQRRSSLKQSGSNRLSVSEHGGREIEVKLPGKDKPVRRRQSISFCEGVTVQAIKPVTEMNKNVNDLWYQSTDLEDMVTRSFRLVKKAAKGKKKYCTRGLENMQDESVIDRVHSAMDAVLGEQDLQYDHGCFDEDRIQETYKRESFECSESARKRAEEDAKAVDAYLSETRVRVRRMSC